MSYIYKRVKDNIAHYKLIENREKICLAISGGADSMAMAHILRHIFPPHKIVFCGIHIDMGFGNGNLNKMRDFLKNLDITLNVKTLNISKEIEKSDNPPCFICSFRRRELIFKFSDEKGIKKVAFAHTENDVAETLLMNIVYHSEIGTILPAQPLFKGYMKIIRPLYNISKVDIMSYVINNRIPFFENPCPYKEDSKRMEIRKWIEELTNGKKQLLNNIAHSVRNIKKDFIPGKNT